MAKVPTHIGPKAGRGGKAKPPPHIGPTAKVTRPKKSALLPLWVQSHIRNRARNLRRFLPAK